MSNNKKRKDVEETTAAASESEDETPTPTKEAKPKKKKARRTKTSIETLKDGAKFLKDQAPALATSVTEKAKTGRVETRNDQTKRELINDLADNKKKVLEEITPEKDAKMRKSFGMVFRLFDKDNDGKLTARELGQAIKSSGKTVDHDKVLRIMKKVGSGDLIKREEFVEYLMKRRFKNVGDRKTPAKEKEKPKSTPKKETEKEKKDREKKEKDAKEKKAKAEKDKKAKAEKDKKAKADKGKAAETTPKKKLLMKRSSSIIDYYGPNVFDEEAAKTGEVDEHSNPTGEDYDLVKEGVFEGINVLIGLFYVGQPSFGKKNFEETAGASLKKKGFNLIYVKSEEKFIKLLPDVDVAWIVSNNEMVDEKTKKEAFEEAVREFHETGGGLYIWANNNPFFFHANIVLENLLGMELKGKSAGGRDLQKVPSGKEVSKGHLMRHEIFTGIQKLYEGKDICHPVRVDPRMIIFAVSEDDRPVILGAEQGPGKLSNKSGRIVIDTGFTKLWQNWPTQAGTPRYVTNATCWLVAVDHKLKLELPVSRVADDSDDE